MADWQKVGKKVGSFFSLIETFEKWKVAINDLNSTNAQAFSGMLLGGLTGLFYFATWIIKMILAFKYAGVENWEMPKIIHLDVFSAWLLFVASWIGFSIRQFKHKRETHTEAGGESIRHAQVRNGGTT
jgi:hypothetical protein